MIFVTLGTQDKKFPRLLDAIDKLIDEGKIKEKVVCQVGYTKYSSNNMEIIDFMSGEEFNEYIKKSSVVITHGGVGSIISALKYDKPIIAVARLKKYGEHANDHQVQIIKRYREEGYLLEGEDFNRLDVMIKKAKKFKPRKLESNNKNFCMKLEKYLEDNPHVSWYNKYREILMYLVFGFLSTVVNVGSFYILDKLHVNMYVNNFIAWTLAVIFAFVTNKKFVFESKTSKREARREFISFILARIFSLGVDMMTIGVLVNVIHMGKILSKVISNIIVIIVNYIFSKLFIFKKKSD